MKKLFDKIKKTLFIRKLKKLLKDENKKDFIAREIKILNIRKIVQAKGMAYSNGEFFFPGGFMLPDYRTDEERIKEFEEKTKNWSEYRKKHGYEEGSYMDIINKKYGGVKGIWVDKDYINPLALLGKITYLGGF